MLDRNRLIAAREARSLNKAELARMSGHWPSYISELENGNRQPSPKELAKIAELLGVEPEDLLVRDDTAVGAVPIPGRTSPVATVPEAAKFLRCSTATVYAMVKDGKLPAVRYGRRNIRLPWRALEEFIEQAAAC